MRTKRIRSSLAAALAIGLAAPAANAASVDVVYDLQAQLTIFFGTFSLGPSGSGQATVRYTSTPAGTIISGPLHVRTTALWYHMGQA